MNISVTRENFLRSLSLVSRITSRNINLPILHNVLIEARPEGITLVTTNLEMSMRVHMRGKVEEVGAFTVPAQILTNYISLLPESEERISVEKKDNEIIFRSTSQHTKLKGEEATEFPLIPDVIKNNPICITPLYFQRAINHVLSAVSHDDTRPELTGVYIDIKNNIATFAATDSYRLAESRIPIQDQGEKNTTHAPFIIPATSMIELSRIIQTASIKEDKGDIQIIIGENQLLFIVNDIEMTSRIIEGVFPDYQQIIPQQFQTTIIMNREETIRAVKAASLFSRAGIHDVNLHFSKENNTATITTVNSQLGENIAKLQARITGDSNTIVFNHRYLLDALTSIETVDFSLSLVDNANPGVFRPSSEENTEEASLYIIMPIKQ